MKKTLSPKRLREAKQESVFQRWLTSLRQQADIKSSAEALRSGRCLCQWSVAEDGSPQGCLEEPQPRRAFAARHYVFSPSPCPRVAASSFAPAWARLNEFPPHRFHLELSPRAAIIVNDRSPRTPAFPEAHLRLEGPTSLVQRNPIPSMSLAS